MCIMHNFCVATNGDHGRRHAGETHLLGSLPHEWLSTASLCTVVHPLTHRMLALAAATFQSEFTSNCT